MRVVLLVHRAQLLLVGLSTALSGWGHAIQLQAHGREMWDGNEQDRLSRRNKMRNLWFRKGPLRKKDYIKDFRRHSARTVAPTMSPTSVEEGDITTETAFTVTRDFTVSPTCGAIEGLEELRIEVCLLTDASGSFDDDYNNLIEASGEIYDEITNRTGAARFGVAAFVDYPVGEFGDPGDYPYRLLSSMSSSRDDWTNGIQQIEILGGDDEPESQYDAIVGAAEGIRNSYVDQPDCGWNQDNPFTHVLVISTDAPFHSPGSAKPHENTQSSTIEALNANSVRVVGLKAPGASDELDQLASATGGTVQALSSDGSDIASAILGGIEDLPCFVTSRAVGCEPLDVAFTPTNQVVPPGGSSSVSVTFSTTDPTLVGTSIQCQVEFSANGDIVSSFSVTINVTE